MTLYTRVFLADDDADDRDLFIDALKEIDHSIHCLYATNGEVALQTLEGDIFEKPELIFLDLNMPKVNGKQLLKHLKNTDTLATIPVIMYSTFFSDNDIDEIKKLGASHYLIKHTKFQELCNSLRSILAQKWA